MSIKIEMKGLDELDKAFDDLINGVEDSLGSTLEKSSKPFFDKVKSNADRVNEKVKIGAVKKSTSNAQVSVTTDAYSKEYGTSTTPAQPFMRSAIDSTNDDVVNNFSKEIENKIAKITK